MGCTQMVVVGLPRHHIAPKSMGDTSKTHAAPNVHWISSRDRVEVVLVLEVSMVRFVLAMATKLKGCGELVVADMNYLERGYGADWTESGRCKPARCGAEVAVGCVAVQI